MEVYFNNNAKKKLLLTWSDETQTESPPT